MTGAATLLESLKRCPLFAGLNEVQIRQLVPLCAESEAEVGSIICKQGDPADALYVVASGRVALELSVPSPEGVPSRAGTVTTVGPGEVFGWSAVVEPFTMTLSARVMDLGPCRLVRIDGPRLRRLMEQDKGLGYEIMVGVARLLASRLMRTKEMLIYERGWADVA